MILGRHCCMLERLNMVQGWCILIVHDVFGNVELSSLRCRDTSGRCNPVLNGERTRSLSRQAHILLLREMAAKATFHSEEIPGTYSDTQGVNGLPRLFIVAPDPAILFS